MRKDRAVADTTWTPVPANLTRQTLRERWNLTMRFEKAERLPNLEFGYWAETLPEWHKQGLPEIVDNEKKAYAYFGIEDWRGAPVNVGMFPSFKTEVVEETEHYIIVRDGDGALRQDTKDGAKTIPHYLEYAVKDRAGWEKIKERLDPSAPGRYPADWDARVAEFRNRDDPLCINIGSMIGKIRNWVGFENLALLAYDDPALLEEMIETCCACVCGTLPRALKDVRFDFGAGWEDICFKNGPVLSPAMFDRWIVPRYQRITGLLRDYGVDICWTDCDGNIMPILDQFLAGGINCMFPLEVAGGTDPVAIRAKYGRKVLLHGGVDKMQLIKGPRAIERELLRLKPVVDEGGFIPHVDHRCPSNVTLKDYRFYLKMKRELFGAGNLLPHYED